ncbi:MAG: hypothetical protein CMN75_17245 [Spirochaeta sp.]|nr:hypothetical protein [Spirochaeta sp.]
MARAEIMMPTWKVVISGGGAAPKRGMTMEAKPLKAAQGVPAVTRPWIPPMIAMAIPPAMPARSPAA